MNRIDFQRLSELRLREANALLAAGFWDGAYYLAGYAMECALKACIAKRTQQHDFPEKDARKYFSHDLDELVGFARLRYELDQARQSNSAMNATWIVVKNWSEESRYETNKNAKEAAELLMAIEDPAEGWLPWVQQRW